jgi:hypothetical protein
MSDARRRAIRLSLFLLPALVVLAGFHVARPDLRDAAASATHRGYFIDGHRYVMRGRKRAEDLSAFVRRFIEDLRKVRIYGFQPPPNGFVIEVVSRPGATESIPGSNRILISGVQDDEPADRIKEDLSRLIALAMLRLGAPDAEFSPWFEEGVSRFYSGSQPPFGSRKDGLLRRAALNPPASVADALHAGRTNFDAISHSLAAFLHESFAEEVIAKFAAIEREPGPVSPGDFERIFGAEVGVKWREFLDRHKKGS